MVKPLKGDKAPDFELPTAEGAPPEARKRLKAATEAFDTALAHHARALAASKTITEVMV